MAKKRADVLLHEKGLVDSREKAKRLIMEGSVLVGTQRVDKPGEKFDEDVDIQIKGNPIKYVSRGGLKLEKAMDKFNIDIDGNITMDIGASTGGFTDCMLQNGASKVYAIDVGYGQLDWSLRNHKDVVVMERMNIRNVTLDDLDESIDFISTDVSFISLKLVLPVAYELLNDKGRMVALIKPQFEAGREKVGKNGIIRDKNTHIEVISEVLSFAEELGFGIDGLDYSPITGAKGNIEFITYLNKDSINTMSIDDITNIVESAHLELK